MSPRTLHRNQARRVPRPGSEALAGARAALADHRSALRRLAHDLRNPLNSILLMAQLLEEAGGSPEATRLALRIQKQCSEMNELVDNALAKMPE